MLNFKQRISDCCYQEWLSSINNSNKLTTYCSFKTLLEPEKYLSCVHIPKFKITLTKFRCSDHKLEIENGRKENINAMERVCKYCLTLNYSCVENEYHFICKCPLYNDLRTKYLYHVKNFNPESFVSLFKSKNEHVLNNLSKYIFYSILKRKSFIQ